MTAGEVGRGGHAYAWAQGGWGEAEGGGEEGGEDSAWGQHGWGLGWRGRGIGIGVALRSGLVYTSGIRMASGGRVAREVLLEAAAGGWSGGAGVMGTSGNRTGLG